MPQPRLALLAATLVAATALTVSAQEGPIAFGARPGSGIQVSPYDAAVRAARDAIKRSDWEAALALLRSRWG